MTAWGEPKHSTLRKETYSGFITTKKIQNHNKAKWKNNQIWAWLDQNTSHKPHPAAWPAIRSIWLQTWCKEVLASLKSARSRWPLSKICFGWSWTPSWRNKLQAFQKDQKITTQCLLSSFGNWFRNSLEKTVKSPPPH